MGGAVGGRAGCENEEREERRETGLRETRTQGLPIACQHRPLCYKG